MLCLIAPFLLLMQASPTTMQSPNEARTAADGPVVLMETSLGSIKIGLYKKKAPISVDNFIGYVRAGHYDGTIFHRVIPGFMIQGGGFDASMTERAVRPPIKNEASNGLRNSRGTIAMARLTAPNSATAQFFINVKDNHNLDYGIGGAGYAVFGEVLEGMDIVDKIVALPTGTHGLYENVPRTNVVITKVRELVPAAK